MLSRSLSLALRLSPHRAITQISVKNSTAANAESTNERDPAPYFFNEEIQQLLKTVTRPIPEKVFQMRKIGQALEAPEYKFMTDEELKNAVESSNKKLESLLQMPPVVKLRKDEIRIINKDPALQGHDQAKYVFTDITFGISNKDRLIVIREPDGTLRTASNVERDRLNQVYFPIKGREIKMPRMFEEEHLEPILARGDYEFVLDRACLQFEPDHEDFHRVTQAVYDRIDELTHHDNLRSTRHYGPMIFYLAWNKKIDNVVLENITTERIEDAALVIKLYYMLNPSEKATKEKDHIKIIQHYIETECGNKRKLDHALKMYLEIVTERQKLLKHAGKTDQMKGNSDTELKT